MGGGAVDKIRVSPTWKYVILAVHNSLRMETRMHQTCRSRGVVEMSHPIQSTIVKGTDQAGKRLVTESLNDIIDIF